VTKLIDVTSFRVFVRRNKIGLLEPFETVEGVKNPFTKEDVSLKHTPGRPLVLILWATTMQDDIKNICEGIKESGFGGRVLFVNMVDFVEERDFEFEQLIGFGSTLDEEYMVYSLP